MNANEFTALRNRARERRDKELARVRADYETSLAQIAELERRLYGRTDPARVKLSVAVEHAIPRDVPFTIRDVLATLEATDPARVWPKPNVGRHITKLRELGLVQRVKRHKTGEGAVYKRTQKPGEKEATEATDKTAREYIAEIVTKPMRTAEVVLAVLEAGFKTTMRPGHFRTFIIRVLREGGFREVAGKWTRG